MKPPMFPSSGHDQNEPASVYVMVCGGRVKIGIARDAESRRAHLQLSCPLPLTIALERRYESRTAARMVERGLHLQLERHRLHGEWFDLEPEAAMQALRDAPDVAPPVTIKSRAVRKPLEPIAPVTTRPPRPALRRDGNEGPTWDDYEAMDDATWADFMRPAAAVLDFLDPDASEKSRALEAGLRVKYPQYFRPSAVPSTPSPPLPE